MLESYPLDPANFYTLPDLVLEAMLKMTKVKLQLFDNIDMVLLIQREIGGRDSMISKKYAKLTYYDPLKPKPSLTY